uniref:Uncharacterized protein n=1 Tax=Arundo donax TaxID=35708 RepID=A0A0A9FHD8_ARUDO
MPSCILNKSRLLGVNDKQHISTCSRVLKLPSFGYLRPVWCGCLQDTKYTTPLLKELCS